jgi:hypothetical protein
LPAFDKQEKSQTFGDMLAVTRLATTTPPETEYGEGQR